MPDPDTSSRLNKIIALRLGSSRRQADELIEKGRVTVNGASAHLGQPVMPSDKIVVNGTLLPTKTDFIYLALHKPVGYVSSRREQGETPTIYSLLPPELHHLKPVGRLDKDSSGLILLTNDGDFAHHMTHPSFRKQKVYEIEINRPLSKEDFHKVTESGVSINDAKPSKFQLVASRSRQSLVASKAVANTGDWGQETRDWRATLLEGRNRQIRRTFEALGYHVTKLHRTHFGDFALDDLKPKEYIKIYPKSTV